jgi:hypothetical protein
MRTYTNKLIEMMDEGLVVPQSIAEMALAYMSEADVEDMMRANELVEDEDDGQPDELQEWESFDPDC